MSLNDVWNPAIHTKTTWKDEEQDRQRNYNSKNMSTIFDLRLNCRSTSAHSTTKWSQRHISCLRNNRWRDEQRSTTRPEKDWRVEVSESRAAVCWVCVCACVCVLKAWSCCLQQSCAAVTAMLDLLTDTWRDASLTLPHKLSSKIHPAATQNQENGKKKIYLSLILYFPPLELHTYSVKIRISPIMCRYLCIHTFKCL